MQIDKAIEILKDFIIQDPDPDFQDIADAIKLGIEGMKRVKACRSEYECPLIDPVGDIPAPLLPGETKD